MVIQLGGELEIALSAVARERGVAPGEVALEALREKFLASGNLPAVIPQDRWEEQLVDVGTSCGISLSHQAVSSEGLYD